MEWYDIGQFIDLTGNKYGRLTVIKRAENQGKKKMWLCKCDCGNEKIVRADSLKNGSIKSCGCFLKESTSKRKFKDLIGLKFGRWTVLQKVESQNKFTKWKCRCECGSVKNVFANSLLNGSSKSCGCLKDETISKNNLIDLTGKTFGELFVVKRVEDYISPSANSGSSTRWLCKCSCGNTVIKYGHQLRNGAKSCGCLDMSGGEYLIKELLDSLNIIYKTEYTFSNCKDRLPLPFDFYLPYNNLCIEYDGIQHYKPVDYFGGMSHFITQQNHDKIKNQYCNDNGIQLLRIPYFYKEKQIKESIINILNP